MKVSLITTVFNEEKTIGLFLDSVYEQIRLPDEIIIVDGGSRDRTISEISEFKIPDSKKSPKIKLVFKKGNRSVGRNEAISRATGEIIAITDAGNILDKDWLKNITSPFTEKQVDVVAGYYRGKFANNFQKSLIPYVLVMEDKINEKDFLPATRSMAIRKSIWLKAGKFDVKLSHNEDYAFASKLKKIGARIVFQKTAIVNWIPRKNIKRAFIMFFRFALGDAEAKLIRDKVIYIFLRYIFFAYLFFLSIIMRSIALWAIFIFLALMYLVWAINKNYRYVNNISACFYLPLLQIVSDFAVMTGTALGLTKHLSWLNAQNIIVKNRGIIILFLCYIVVMLSVIGWGIPNANHPFTYNMDEWHFSQSLRAFLKYGTATVSGSANIPLFHIISTILFLVPFYVLHIINPFAIKSAVGNLVIQHTFFEVLRLHTLLYGILTISLIYYALKKFIGFKPLLMTCFFVISPIWIFLSNYYKYDITLSFWIVATIVLLLGYNNTKRISFYLFAGISCALALSTKFTAFPLVLSYFLAYFIFSTKINLKHFLTSLAVFIFVFSFVGIPDIILGKGNYYELLSSTLVRGPVSNSGYNLGLNSQLFLMLKEFPALFGYVLIGIGYLNIFYWPLVFWKNIKDVGQYRPQLYLYITFVMYLISSVSFGIDGGNNRALVLLPFIVLLSAYTVNHFIKAVKFNKEIVIVLVLTGAILLQLIQTFAWQSVKLSKDPQVSSSSWLVKNLPKGSIIGIENIPIYQSLPNIILKEYSAKAETKNLATNFEYRVISAKDKNLPNIVVISNDYKNVSYIQTSPKKDLVKRLNANGYIKVTTFTPNTRYFDMFSDPLVFVLLYPSPKTISVYRK